VVCLSVCHDHEPRNKGEPTEMPLGVWTLLAPRNHVLDGVQINSQRNRGNFEEPRTCEVADTLTVTQQGAALLWCRCRFGVLDGVHIGETW